MKTILCLCVCFSVCALSVTGLSCVRDLTCTKLKALFMFCKYGVVSGPCRDCQCAKGPGEECGGMFNLSGICVRGFYCKKDCPIFGVGRCMAL